MVAIDTNITGNDDTNVGTIEDCGEIATVGGTLTFDLVVVGIDDADRIAGYQFDIDYDPSIINVTSFIDADAAGSTPPNNVTIVSRIVSSGGIGFLSLSDIATNPSSMTMAVADSTFSPPPPDNHESGDGVLARITVEAVGAGSSPLTIPSTLGGADSSPDAVVSDGDGANHIPGDEIPITTIQSGEIVVGGSCAGSFVDSDSDGFLDGAEGFVGTDAMDACADTDVANDEADDKWPADFDDNRVVNITDVFQLFPPVFGSSVGDAYYSERRDLDPNGVINITDIFRVFPPVFGQTCTDDDGKPGNGPK